MDDLLSSRGGIEKKCSSGNDLILKLKSWGKFLNDFFEFQCFSTKIEKMTKSLAEKHKTQNKTDNFN